MDMCFITETALEVNGMSSNEDTKSKFFVLKKYFIGMF